MKHHIMRSTPYNEMELTVIMAVVIAIGLHALAIDLYCTSISAYHFEIVGPSAYHFY